MTVSIITIYRTSDEKDFDSFEEAEAHETKQSRKADDNYHSYVNSSYSGTRVVKEYGLNKYGTWEVKGEDANADFGGHHYQPSLGFFQGTLEQVIRKAVSLPRFYTWGGGGTIIYTTPPEVLSL